MQYHQRDQYMHNGSPRRSGERERERERAPEKLINEGGQIVNKMVFIK